MELLTFDSHYYSKNSIYYDHITHRFDMYLKYLHMQNFIYNRFIGNQLANNINL